MFVIRKCLTLVMLAGIAAPALADGSPAMLARPIDPADTIAAMLASAYRSGDDATIRAVVGVAKATFPDQAAEIDRLAAGNAAVLATTRREEQMREQQRIADATFFEIWKGELELGASVSNGNANVTGIYASAKLNRDGLRWRQKFAGRIDYQRTNGVTSTERVLMAYQPNYKMSDDSYAYGLVQYERDRSLGYSDRETIGGGIGLTAFKSRYGKIDIEGGPALRETAFLGEPNRTTIAGRASLAARYALSPTLNFSQDASVFVEAGDATASSTSAIDTRLIGRLKAKLSYNVQFEQDTLEGHKSVDRSGRATLVYAF
jgi:putative salt-induced outer membrane protein